VRNVGWLILIVLLTPAAAWSQEPPPVTTFASIGRHEPDTILHRTVDRVDDKLDRCVCCAYGKTHNDIGVQSFRGTKTFLFGSACEFFSIPCRTPPPEPHPLFRWFHRNGDVKDCGCR